MDTKVKQTNTTEASATLSHDDLVKVLGLAVMMDAGLPRDLPGTSVSVELLPVAGTDNLFTVAVDIVIDHNFVPPQADASDSDASADPSLNPGGGTPAAPPAPPALPAPPVSGLQIPGAPASAVG